VPPTPKTHRFFTAHQAAVVEDATARIAPGPSDDPAEKGHPGAREANVTAYIDTMLAALEDDPPKIFAGGPARFIPLDPISKIAWRNRLTTWQDQYRIGIQTLDKLAGGDFTKATAQQQDKILANPDVSPFTALLFGTPSRACTPAPNTAATTTWPAGRKSVSPATSSRAATPPPRWSAPMAVTPVDNTGIVADVLKILGAL
jgi:hypothetical protein